MIPEFLLRENRPEPTEFDLLLDEYVERFNDSPPTEPSLWTEEKWIKVLKKCLKKNKTFEEVTGIIREKGVLY